jgi:hypothetical protein
MDDVGMPAVAEVHPEPAFVRSALVIEHRDRSPPSATRAKRSRYSGA